MLKSIFCLLLLAGSPQIDAFKKEMAPLQSAVDSAIGSTGARVFTPGKASYLDGYGVIVVVEVMLEPPQNIFSTPKSAAQVKNALSQRQKDLKEKLSELLKLQVLKAGSIAETETMTVIVHLLPTTRADVPDAPTQLVMSIKKGAPTQVNIREF